MKNKCDIIWMYRWIWYHWFASRFFCFLLFPFVFFVRNESNAKMRAVRIRKWRYNKQNIQPKQDYRLFSARTRKIRMITKICGDQGQIRNQDKLDMNQPKMSNNFKQFINWTFCPNVIDFIQNRAVKPNKFQLINAKYLIGRLEKAKFMNESNVIKTNASVYYSQLN